MLQYQENVLQHGTADLWAPSPRFEQTDAPHTRPPSGYMQTYSQRQTQRSRRLEDRRRRRVTSVHQIDDRYVTAIGRRLDLGRVGRHDTEVPSTAPAGSLHMEINFFTSNLPSSLCAVSGLADVTVLIRLGENLIEGGYFFK